MNGNVIINTPQVNNPIVQPQVPNDNSDDEDMFLDPLLNEDDEDEDGSEDGNQTTNSSSGSSSWVWKEVNIEHVNSRSTRAGTTVTTDHMPPFEGPPSGPINIPEDCKRPIDYFRLFMDDEIMTTFVVNTNSFIVNKHGESKTKTTITELFSLFACFLYMGIVCMPSMSLFILFISFWKMICIMT